jgi:hypothetical protein
MAEYITGKSISENFRRKSEADLMSMYPKGMSEIDGIRIGTESRFRVSTGSRAAAVYGSQHDSLLPAEPSARSYWCPCDERGIQLPVKPLIRFEADPQVALHTKSALDSLISSGVTPADAKKRITGSLRPVFFYDAQEKQYVVKPLMKGVNDSMLTSSAIPYWNIGIMYRIFKQPYAASKASRLVSVESFGNAWCDMVMVFKEAFEGYARINNTALGDVEQTNSSPVLNKFGTIMSRIYNIAIDYDSSIAEALAAGAGTPLTAQGIGDRERFAAMMLNRIQDQLTYFGDAESGFTGLMQSCTPVTYTGTALHTIYKGSSTTKGSDITKEFIGLIADFMLANHYMSNLMNINVSPYTYQALTSTLYSDNFNGESPMETIQKHFAQGEDLGGGLKKLSLSFAVDAMLDPTVTGGSVNPFNTNAYDLTYFTVPSVSSAMGDEMGLVILPEPLSTFIVPPIMSRQGMLYTQYKRIGGIIAPIAGTVAVYKGLGYSE